MYVLQPQPDKEAFLRSSSIGVKPLATLKSSDGGVCHIVEDDHCYLLLQGGHQGVNDFIAVKHWFHEAVEALKTLPSLK
jgi:hypothetical protein